MTPNAPSAETRVASTEAAAASPAPVTATALPAPTAAILQTAFDLIGTPYRWGGQTPETGFDCSGFVSYVLRQHAIQIPRTTAEQFGTGRSVAQDEIQPGDLVFFSTTGPGATHVGLVVASGTEWKFVHAPADGSTVRIERFDTGYWQQRWLGARRVF